MTTSELPRLERATREHALRYARAAFERGERVDMQTLATELGVGRTTLYRWFGDREQVISELFADLTEEIFTGINDGPGGGGIEAALESIRRFMTITAAFEPLRDFAQREPALALRILLAPQGSVQQQIRAGVTRALEQHLPARQLPLPPDIIDVLVQVGANLQWTPIVIGDLPDIDRALQLGRSVLEVHLP